MVGEHPEKLYVTYFPPATSYRPVHERRYTFAKDIETGDCYLTVGYCYDESIINSDTHKDMIFQWTFQEGKYVLVGAIFQNDKNRRHSDMEREIREALVSLVYGDKKFFLNYPNLLSSPIYIQMDWNDGASNQIIHCGSLKHFFIID